eukprot:c22854_g2_i1 orf=1-1587(-)
MYKPRNAHQGIRKCSPASVYHLFEIEEKSPLLQCADELNESQFFTEIDGKDIFVSSMASHGKGVGLVRSQSFPPQGWYKTTSKYILKISNDDRLLINRGNEDEDDVCQRPSDSIDASFECASSMVVDTTEHLPDDASFVPEQMLDTSLVSESGVNSMLAGVNMVTYLPGVVDAPATTATGDDNSLHGGRSLSTLNMVDSACEVPPKLLTIAEESVSVEVPPKLLTIAEESVSVDWRRLLNVSNSASELPQKLSTIAAGPVLIDRRHISSLVIPPSGKLLVCGRRREMEDTAAIVPSFLSVPYDKHVGHETWSEKETVSKWHFFGVFDGHGGSQASNYCMERFHHVVAEEFIKVSGSLKDGGAGDECNMMWAEIMKAAFSNMDKEVGGVCPNVSGQDDDNALDGGCLCCENAIAPENVGTTATVAIVGSHQMVVANCGDSRAVLARGGQAIPLSKDHKPELEDETRRIEAAGGRVICWDGYRVGGLLALSRAIGDRYLKRYVISEPEVRCIQRSEDDECLILASDGLWDV